MMKTKLSISGLLLPIQRLRGLDCLLQGDFQDVQWDHGQELLCPNWRVLRRTLEFIHSGLPEVQGQLHRPLPGNADQVRVGDQFA